MRNAMTPTKVQEMVAVPLAKLRLDGYAQEEAIMAKIPAMRFAGTARTTWGMSAMMVTLRVEMDAQTLAK
jgi:hypothetical protein